MFNKKAEMGIGTLILFIAMILVAAVAAGVLIQTASSLQAKALLTGSKSTSEVSTAIQITYAYGKNASGTDHTLEHTFIKTKLVPGSDPIKLSDLVITVDTNSARQSYTYSSTLACDPTNYSTVAGTNTYSVRYLTNGGSGQVSDSYLYRGDVLEICINNPTNGDLTEGTEMKITATPKTGQEASISVKAPDVMIQDSVPLYP